MLPDARISAPPPAEDGTTTLIVLGAVAVFEV
jgi:hypothetical protein